MGMTERNKPLSFEEMANEGVEVESGSWNTKTQELSVNKDESSNSTKEKKLNWFQRLFSKR